MNSAAPPDDAFGRAKANLYPGALPHIDGWKKGRLEKRSSARWSSQALCISVWGTLDGHPAQDAILAEVLTASGLDVDLCRGQIKCEVRTLRDLLQEQGGGNPTSRDVVIDAPTGVVVVESKFTETLGGCSQPRTVVQGRSGPGNEDIHNCSGDFKPGSDQKTGSTAPCRLMVQDGRRRPRRYWEVGARLFKPEVLQPPQSPCPFRGPAYQLMRNLCFAAAFAERFDRPAFGLLVAYVGRARHAHQTQDTIADFRRMLRPKIAPNVGAVTYETIADILDAHDPHLAIWIRDRIASVLRA